MKLTDELLITNMSNCLLAWIDGGVDWCADGSVLYVEVPRHGRRVGLFGITSDVRLVYAAKLEGR